MQTTHVQVPTRDPATIQALIARFRQGMPDPGMVTVALLAAHYRCSWAEARRLLTSIPQMTEERRA